jgi:hypothetical protein
MYDRVFSFPIPMVLNPEAFEQALPGTKYFFDSRD